jgi:stage V sporulation protein AE
LIYINAFLIGGLICGAAQIIMNLFKLTVGHMTTMFVCIGTLLDFGGFYDKLIEIAGAGALLPITNFGHSLVHASFEKAKEVGLIGVLTGLYDKTSLGIGFTVLLAVVIALICKPKS